MLCLNADILCYAVTVPRSSINTAFGGLNGKGQDAMDGYGLQIHNNPLHPLLINLFEIIKFYLIINSILKFNFTSFMMLQKNYLFNFS
jgi:hypothetical protein